MTNNELCIYETILRDGWLTIISYLWNISERRITDNKLVFTKNTHRWITKNSLYVYGIWGPADHTFWRQGMDPMILQVKTQNFPLFSVQQKGF